MKKIIIVLSVCVSFAAQRVNAQAVSSDDIKSTLVKEWQRAKAYTIEYLEAMPADKYNFKAVDSIRSFSQQMLHLASGNFFLMLMASDITPPAFSQGDLEHRNSAMTKDSVMYFVKESYDYCINAVQNTPTGKWGEKKKMRTNEETRLALMLKTFEHQTHHRGQATIYIRLVGIRPPAEKLF
jgi:uncharacterized damage-inducible protein DinB